MEKLNIRNKEISFSFQIFKKSNSNLKDIEEYQSCFDIINKENEINGDIYKIRQNLFNIYDKLLSATNEYSKKIDQIYENLKPNENSYEGRIQIIIYNILNNISKALKNIFNKFNYIKNLSNYEGSKSIKEDLIEHLLQKMKKLKQQRNLYLEEINNYEIYLVNKELGLIEKNEGKDIINENVKENKSNSKEISIYDNHNKVYEKQSQYINSKEDLKNFIKILFINLNSERKILYNSIYSNINDLVNYIYFLVFKIK